MVVYHKSECLNDCPNFLMARFGIAAHPDTKKANSLHVNKSFKTKPLIKDAEFCIFNLH